VSLNDPELVRAEYATEEGLRARRSVYTGEVAAEVFDEALAAVAEARPSRVLEVGCRWGEFAARVRDELGAEVVAVDISLVGRDRSAEPTRFFAETGETSLRRHFSRVERRDLRGEIDLPSAAAVRAYIAASVAHKHLAQRVPEFEGPLRATCANAVFVAETAT
jgi:hypothetical protein